MTSLNDFLDDEKTETKEAEKPTAPKPETTLTDVTPLPSNEAVFHFENHLVAQVEIEAVIGGALMRVRLDGPLNPRQVPEMIRQIDPTAKFRDDFPSKSFGKRDTKSATALVLAVDVRDQGKFISITGTTPEGEDLTISVSKKGSDEWLPNLERLGKLSEKSLDKIKAAYEAKKTATVILSDAEQFNAKYWSTEDGKAFLDSMEAHPPKPTPKEGNGTK